MEVRRELCEATAWLDHDARTRHETPFDALTPEDRAAAIARLTPRIRRNTYDAASDTVTVPAERALAMRSTASDSA